MSVKSCDVKRVKLSLLTIHVGTVLNQHFRNVNMSISSCHVKRCLFVFLNSIQWHGSGVPSGACAKKSSINVGTDLNQQVLQAAKCRVIVFSTAFTSISSESILSQRRPWAMWRSQLSYWQHSRRYRSESTLSQRRSRASALSLCLSQQHSRRHGSESTISQRQHVLLRAKDGINVGTDLNQQFHNVNMSFRLRSEVPCDCIY